MVEGDEIKNVTAARSTDSMANERTFLAWTRTSIGIMAFGFVVERFTLFLKQLSILISRTAVEPAHAASPSLGHTSVFGVVVVAVGALLSLLAYVNYHRTERKIAEGKYEAPTLLPVALALVVFSIGMYLMAYLARII